MYEYTLSGFAAGKSFYMRLQLPGVMAACMLRHDNLKRNRGPHQHVAVYLYMLGSESSSRVVNSGRWLVVNE
jgi:hypothetical protein